jgi:hypothetical integral membrane protein (TIGR02206 family)
MTAGVQPIAYGATVAAVALAGAVLCVAARTNRGGWTITAANGLGLVLLADAVTWTVALIRSGDWSARESLPLALCNMAVIVAAAACLTRLPLLVELTYFWGLAGTLQAVVTPDLHVAFPHLVFFEYVVGHTGIVVAALYLAVGLRLTPRPGAVVRVLTVTAGYTAFVGLVDWLSGANYMFLRHPPSSWTLLRLLGPWPWYIASAAGVALILLVVLDVPFWPARRQGRRNAARPVMCGMPGAACEWSTAVAVGAAAIGRGGRPLVAGAACPGVARPRRRRRGAVGLRLGLRAVRRRVRTR